MRHQDKPRSGGIDVTRLTRRFSRRVLRRSTFAYFVWRFIANGVRTARFLVTRRSYAETAAISHELSREGIVVDASRRFLTDGGQEALTEAGERVLATSRSSRVEKVLAGQRLHTTQKQFLLRLVSYPHGMPSDEPLLRVAIDPKLLEVVSHYFGLWPCLYSVGAWLNYATDAPPELSQLWHRDPEDLKVIKVFIYLTDVDERCGPFSYIPGTYQFGRRNARAQKLGHKKRLVDDKMARVFPRSSWRLCTGPASTMILADTVGYHRGGKPEPGRRRLLITFTYTSATPITDRALRVRELPVWATSPIQRFAVGPLLEASRGAPANVTER